MIKDNYQANTRNKLIAEAFYLTGDIEKYGSGFVRIRKELKKYPTMKMELEEIPNGFLAVLSYTKQRMGLVEDNITDNRRKHIVELMKKNKKITPIEMANSIGVVRKTIARDLEL